MKGLLAFGFWLLASWIRPQTLNREGAGGMGGILKEPSMQ